MHHLVGGISLPEVKIKGGVGGGVREYWLPTYQQQSKMSKVAAMEMKMATMNALAAKSKANVRSTAWDFRQSNLDVDWQHLLQSGRFKAALNRQWKQSLSTIAMSLESKVLMMKMQNEKAMAEEKRRSQELAKLLKKAMGEKESWEKVARQMNIIVTSMKQALKQGQQNYITCFSSSAAGDVIVGEEVASNFRSNFKDEEEEVEPAAKRKKLGGWNQWRGSSSTCTFSLCKICRSRVSCMVLLPCRHVNMCKHCASLQHGCPLCKQAIDGEIEILFS